ncbi:S26 family signal peptidase [Salinigranum rubrum]|uniref:S26 family signal peptidase n=1 Tax=Salinigranum rubrum TaxID=755307 RepID=UPI0037436890
MWTAQSGPLFFLREVGTSIGAVVLVGLVLFGVSGVWPPMVAVESGSMEPHMHKGDLVFITEPGRYTPDAAYEETGVVTAETGSDIDYRTFGGPGSVVVYDDPGRGGPPIIHRAEFYVEEGENWYDRADPEFISADSCDELRNCPAPHGGFITKGDANGRYDQVSGIAEPVKPSWVTGIARIRIPYLGWVRLGLSDIVQTGAYGLVEVRVTDETRQLAVEPTATDRDPIPGEREARQRLEADTAQVDVVEAPPPNAAAA